ncbi:MAG TPA: F0F1 ATP synthase subunit A [Stellaceae bacterium]
MAVSKENPLNQFLIDRIVPIHIGGVDASFTNSALLMIIAAGLITLLIVGATWRAALVPGRLQSISEMLYEFIAKMIDDNVGHEGLRYFPFIFTLFMFILFGNLLGMIPYSFTFTSHIIVTFGMSIVIFVGVTFIGLWRHGLHFLKLFVPHGVPIGLLAVVVPIEVLSYFIRPMTLSIRLFANMMAGHTMLAIFAGFVAPLGAFYLIPGLLPIALDVALIFLELLVAVLQAYVFAILTTLYLAEAIHLH